MKRPVVILLLAVILGECVAITGYIDVIMLWFIVLICSVLALGLYWINKKFFHSKLLRKNKITTKHFIWFGVILFFFMMGYKNEIYQEEKSCNIYKLQGEHVLITGKCIGIVKTKTGYNSKVVNAMLRKTASNNTESICGNTTVDNCKIIIQSEEYPDFEIGDFICVTGKNKLLTQAQNIGNFDEKLYYKNQGIYSVLTNINTLKSKSCSDKKILLLIDKVRQGISDTIDRLYESIKEYDVCDEQKVGIFKAITIGDKTMLDDETKYLYRNAGISHVLTISGLHISMVGIFIYKILRRKFKFIISGIVSLVIVIFFCGYIRWWCSRNQSGGNVWILSCK